MWKYNDIYSPPQGELMHYGVMGMRWGVRKYRKKDGSLTEKGKKHYAEKGAKVTKAGKSWTHVSSSEEIPIEDKIEKNWAISAYDTKNKHDGDVYRGVYARGLNNGLDWIYNYKDEYVTKYDTISPSKKEKVDTYVDMFIKNKRKFSKIVNDTDQEILAVEAEPFIPNEVKKYWNYSFTALDTKRLAKDDKYIRDNGEKLYKSFIQRQVKNDKKSIKIRNQFYKELLKKGYDTIDDDRDRDRYNKAETSTIFLNPKNSLKYKKGANIWDDETAAAYKRIIKDSKKRKYDVLY